MPDEDTAYTVNGYKDTTVPSTSDSSAASSEETTSDSGGTDVYSGRYLGNKNTKKFHTTQCRYIKKTSEENITIFETYEDAISDGYIACSVCNQ